MKISQSESYEKAGLQILTHIDDATSNYMLFTLSSNVYHHHFKMSMDISVFYPAP